MEQLGLVLSESDVHAMMKSVGIGPHGKISHTGKSCLVNKFSVPDSHTLLNDVHQINEIC